MEFLIKSRFTIPKISLHFNLQFLHEIKSKFDDSWCCGIDLKLSFIIYHFPQFLSSIHCPIWSILKNTSRISLFPYGYDPYLPLCHSIRVNFPKLVSSVLFLTRDSVKSMTSWSRLVTFSPLSFFVHSPWHETHTNMVNSHSFDLKEGQTSLVHQMNLKLLQNDCTSKMTWWMKIFHQNMIACTIVVWIIPWKH